MTGGILKYLLYFLLLFAADIFIVSQVQVTVYADAHIYLMFLLLLPVRSSRSLLIITGFFSGLIMDVFLNTGGLHAAATTLMALARILILPMFMSVEDYDNNNAPTLSVMGSGRYLFFTAVMVLIHHTAYFILEVFDHASVLQLIVKIIISTVVSVLMMFLIQLFFAKKSTSNAGRNR